MKFEDMTKEELREAVLDQSMSMQLALVTSPCIPLGFARGAGSVYIKVRDLLTDIKSGNTPDMPDARAYIALMETLEESSLATFELSLTAAYDIMRVLEEKGACTCPLCQLMDRIEASRRARNN